MSWGLSKSSSIKGFQDIKMRLPKLEFCHQDDGISMIWSEQGESLKVGFSALNTMIISMISKHTNTTNALAYSEGFSTPIPIEWHRLVLDWYFAAWWLTSISCHQNIPKLSFLHSQSNSSSLFQAIRENVIKMFWFVSQKFLFFHDLIFRFQSWMVLFRLILDQSQFVSSLDSASVLLTFKFDAIWFMS